MIKDKKKIPIELKIGTALVLGLLIVALLAPYITAYPPEQLLPDLLSPPSKAYPFGTDGIGRDVFSMVVYGTRTSLFIGIVTALLSMLIGVAVGSISGFYGGKIDIIISEILNIFSMVPSLFLIILVISVFGSSIRNVVLVIGLTSWPGTARIMRAQTMALKERTFVKAYRVLGQSNANIIFKHLIPHGLSPVLVNLAISVSNAILSESSLAFLGLGDPNVISWGQIINIGKKYILSGWWIMLFPGLAIGITVYAFHLIAEGMDKYLSESEIRG
ncbi:MAG: ABC transporter permease [Finegoldia sp.]|nr:ABC transporter permease [Finegoldia sp.]